MDTVRPRLDGLGTIRPSRFDIWAIQLQGNSDYFMTISSNNRYGDHGINVEVYGPQRDPQTPGGSWQGLRSFGSIPRQYAYTGSSCRPTRVLQILATNPASTALRPLEVQAATLAAIQNGDQFTCPLIRTSADSGDGIHYIDMIAGTQDTPVNYTMALHKGEVTGQDPPPPPR
jgi:hypothetical protein